MNIHAGFVTEFLSYHKVKNLRTLEKAQHFFEDVELFCDGIQDEQFIEEVKLICFAIVVESIEKLYKKPEKNNNGENSFQINNKLEHRLLNYLSGIKSGRSLLSILLQYHQNEVSISSKEMNAEYRVYLQAGKKANFYRTDNEIELILPDLEKDIESAETLGELNKFVDEYVVWSDILQIENEDILEKYQITVRKMFEKMIIEGKEEILDYSYDLFHMSSEKVKKIYSEEKNYMKEFLINLYISNLKHNTQGKTAFNYSYKLRNRFDNNYYKEIVKRKLEPLYNKNSFPIDLMSEDKYHTCYNIMYVLYHSDNEKFLHYCEEIKKSCDKMAIHRITVLMKEIIK